MSEFREDLVSGDWIISAPERAKRPHDFLPKKERPASPKETCPFEDLQKSGNWPPILLDPDPDWKIAVISNKYPALTHQHICAEVLSQGPYRVAQGVGHHELVITRDHGLMFMDLPPEGAYEVFRVFQERYRSLADDNCVQYVVVFMNYGLTAGASLYHPHYQIFALPIIPPEVAHSLRGSAEFSAKRGGCAHCEMITFEEKEARRIVAENELAIAFAPFASSNPFEVRIFPKYHEAFFEKSDEKTVRAAADLLQDVLRRMREHLNDPDLNFFVHSSPLKEEHPHYHWHIEILPKISIPAGFELSTGIQINVIDPNKAALLLREGVF